MARAQAEVPLEVQNAMRIKRLEERAYAPAMGIDKEAWNPPCIPSATENQINRSIRPLAGSGSGSAGQCPPPTRPSIGESANRIHDKLDTVHGLIDVVAERLNSVSMPYPKSPPTAASPATPTTCGHMATLDGATDRLSGVVQKLNMILDNLMI